MAMLEELPAFEEDGNLPEGIYTLHRAQLAQHFATTPRRVKLLERLLHL